MNISTNVSFATFIIYFDLFTSFPLFAIFFDVSRAEEFLQFQCIRDNFSVIDEIMKL